MTSESVLAYCILWKKTKRVKGTAAQGEEVSDDHDEGGVPAYHGLVVEGEALQLPQGVGGGGKLFEDDEGLSPHLHRLHGHDVDDLPELGEERVERALQLCGRKMRRVQTPSQTSRHSSWSIFIFLL